MLKPVVEQWWGGNSSFSPLLCVNEVTKVSPVRASNESGP